jgi:predicted TPR repeat methyltransferase
MMISRNSPCPCGSGKKYKQCCLRKFTGTTANPASKKEALAKQLRIAIEHHRKGQIPQAESIYEQILAVEPNHADALHFSGVIFHQRGNNNLAIDYIGRAIKVNPSDPFYYNNLGIALKAIGKPDNAAENYRKALAIKPDYADAHNNLGDALMTLGQLVDAAESYRQAIKFDPEKYECTQHLIAACTGITTDAPPGEYIEKVFDEYANTFDNHLVQKLGYKMPKELVALLGQTIELPDGKWDVLDLGCGTGLSGLEILPHAKQLVGVDLSTKMLEKAKARNIYQRLEHSDLLTMMRNEAASSYDVIIAADVFIYLGRLDDIVSEVRRLLRAGGFFLFSVEAMETTDSNDLKDAPEFRLNHSVRYAHSVNYLEKLAAAHDFSYLNLVSIPVRLEQGNPVTGWATIWKH